MKCERCGKEHDGSFGSGRFCCKSCANARTHSNKTKSKIRESINKNGGPANKKDLSKEVLICPICGKEYNPYRNKYGTIKRNKTCSPICAKQLNKINCTNTINEKVKNGEWKGWQSRNIISYPEQFWINVLKNNNIAFQKEYHFNKYFLDFYIEKGSVKIDLEIDGKQHLTEERSLKDKERDLFLTENGFLVYRIPWNEINSDEGSSKMKLKIEEFLLYYNTKTRSGPIG